ncbi:hypothetical protein NDU88_002166 [Pleurodeles waltl]|uniref:Uncharacterized protein n=1 Tax=Pleurodeles waltl TaxID=8319 RepID=A0AAV7RA53_PLEWA|nr:hypothetical protein NDU88_002166 [Pleurodeles waltl]
MRFIVCEGVPPGSMSPRSSERQYCFSQGRRGAEVGKRTPCGSVIRPTPLKNPPLITEERNRASLGLEGGPATSEV